VRAVLGRARVLLFSGGGDYVDPWHPFAETSEAVAELLRHDGHDVTVVDTVDALTDALTDARRRARPGLVVVNAGSGPLPHSRDDQLFGALASHVNAGSGLLALHVASTLFGDRPEWEELLGGRWVRGTSMHPARGPFTVEVDDPRHPITAGLTATTTVDEAYSWLRVGNDARVLVSHELEGTRHALLWVRRAGTARIVYLALGHDAEAWTFPVPQALLRGSARWALTR